MAVNVIHQKQSKLDDFKTVIYVVLPVLEFLNAFYCILFNKTNVISFH